MSYQTTFVNQNTENNVTEEGLGYLNSVRDDLKKLLDSEYHETDDLGSLYEYGLSIDIGYDDKKEFVRYQIATGGPGYEVRFHQNGDIEFVYLSWFAGVGFDVTHDRVFRDIRDVLSEVRYDLWDEIEAVR